MKIIYISGIDGCGKTTQSKLVVDILQNKGYNADYMWLRWEPFLQKVYRIPQLFIKHQSSKKNSKNVTDIENIDHNKWSSFKKNLLLNTIIRKLWWTHACTDYYFQARKRMKNITSDIVVVDRYVDDFIIDQALNFSIDFEGIHNLKENFFIKKFISPILKIIIDIPASVGYDRKCDGTPLDYLKEREKYYKAIPSSSDTIHVDGRSSIDTLSTEIEQIVESKLR